MTYYKITCSTPFVGEENNYYLKIFHDDELQKAVDECVYECSNEWYDERSLEENDFTEEEYYAECHVISIEEITEEEYYEACPWEE